MKVSGIQVRTCNFVNFGTISEIDKKRAINEGFKAEEVKQAEAMHNFHYYYTSGNDFKVRLGKELKKEDAKSSLGLYEDYFDDNITPEDLYIILSGLQRVQNRENGIKSAYKNASTDFDDYGDGDR